MSDISEDSEVSDIESETDSDVDLAQEITESESSEDENVPNQRPWFRIYPPEIDELQQNFAENVGLQDAPPRNSRPISYFFLFMTMDFLRQIVTETNRYAADYIASKDRIQRFSRLHDWFKVGVLTLRDLKAFLAVILNMGIIKKPVITEYWNTKKALTYDPTPAGMLQGSYVVNSLLDSCNFFNKYYHVVTDSFFTSLDLAKELLRKGTFLTGTLRKNRVMPSSIKNPTIDENEAKFLRQGQLLLCAYKEARRRKPVRLLSTACRAELNYNGKPKMIEYYNTKMGGIDLADQLVSAYVDDRKTMKVWKKIVFNLLQRMVTNAYIHYKQNSDAPRLSRLSFLQSIIEDLAQEHLLSRQQRLPNRELNNARIRLRKIPDGKEKDCSGCSDRNGWNGRNRTRTVCVRCGNGLHKKCKHNHVCVEE
ncbi:unnamed protein product [Mytilus coruscus]|uniref:PiggyBac transposable element-derived protein domain-containing protein n=1 Tax=Mytilus coruscus TaxID=42192 RepID=A0A6J8BN48_MYTCO|nr:unnamed protein product [Mytilus coruscus]